MSPEEVAERLNGRPSGDGWSARCPAHEDRSPSLSIAAGDNLELSSITTTVMG